MSLIKQSLILCLAGAKAIAAQYGGGWRGGSPSGGNSDNGNNAGQFRGNQGGPSQSFVNSRQTILIAHGVLAALAFVLFFPLGSILIRLGTFRRAWLVHGIFQLFAYVVYIIAFALGIWMVNNIPYSLLNTYHPIIGIVLFILLFFQPILGYVHHVQYGKYSRRTIWSYGHLWLGRIVITLGMINGGLGMLLASDAPAFLNFRPSRGQIVAYGVIAGIMWLLWVAAIVIGERRRRTRLPVPAAKETRVQELELPPPHTSPTPRFA